MPAHLKDFLLTSSEAARLLDESTYAVSCLRKRGMIQGIDLGPGVGWVYSRYELECKLKRKMRNGQVCVEMPTL